MNYLSLSAALLLAVSSSLSFASVPTTYLVWKDKGMVKQKVSLATCKDTKAHKNPLWALKEYRIFEINNDAFWGYIEKTANRPATIRLPFPDGSTAPVRLDVNNPVQTLIPEISRIIHESGKIAGKEIIYGSLMQTKTDTNILRWIKFDTTTTDTTYQVSIEPLPKVNQYAVYDTRNQFACPRPPLRRH